MATRKNTCRKQKYGWNTRRVARSPFRTLRRAHSVERAFHSGKSIGFTARSSLKSQGRIPRSDGCYTLGTKYQG
jgi:hypothetical protein